MEREWVAAAARSVVWGLNGGRRSRGRARFGIAHKRAADTHHGRDGVTRSTNCAHSYLVKMVAQSKRRVVVHNETIVGQFNTWPCGLLFSLQNVLTRLTAKQKYSLHRK